MIRDQILQLPYDLVSEEVRRATSVFLNVCRQFTPNEHLYGFVWGVDSDISSLNFRANTEEGLVRGTDLWVQKHADPLDRIHRTEVLNSRRYSPGSWTIDDTSVGVEIRRQLPGSAIHGVWESFQALCPDDDDELFFTHCSQLQHRLVEAIVHGVELSDREYAWSDIDRSQFYLSVHVWGGKADLNLSIAKRLNSPEIFEKTRY